MAASLLKEALIPAAIIIAGFACIVGLSGFIEASRPTLPAGYEDTDLTVTGAKLKGFAFGTEGLIADYYFMRSLQYVGAKLVKNPEVNMDDLRSLNPRLLYPLLDNATDLDPHFVAAYSYGAVVLPAIEPEKAIALAHKGIANNPEQWRLYQHLAYIYWKLERYDDAASTYEKGSEIPGAAPFMKLMAGAMRSQGGSRETARAMFTQMLESSDDEAVRITAERRLAELDSLDEREAIDKALVEFQTVNGHCPASLEEVFHLLTKTAAGKDFHVDAHYRVVDPTGAPYVLDRTQCSVKTGATSLPQAGDGN